MPQITSPGLKLARQLFRSYESNFPAHQIQTVSEICSLICRSAPSYKRLQERRCSDPSFGAADERDEDNIERRLVKLVNTLPPISPTAKLGIRFRGDPRCHTIKITRPGDTESHENSVGVPNS